MNKPILLTRGIVVFPSTETIIEVGRTKSINAINLANEGDMKLLISSQKEAQIEEPKFNDIYSVGTLCEIVKIENADDGSSKVTIKGLKRVKITSLNVKNNAYNSDYEVLKEVNTDAKKNNEGIQLLYAMMQKTISELSDKEAKALKALFLTAPSASKITDQIAMVIASNVAVKQSLLEELDVAKRINTILGLSANNDDRKKVDNDINKQVNDTLQKQQKEFYLREKMRVVKEQLGEINSKENDNNSFKKRLEENPYPEHIKKRVLAELNHMEAANPQENSITRTYIE
jgi:ATP-dependent Lon protease